MDELLARVTQQIAVPRRMGAPALVAHLLARAVFSHVVEWVTPDAVFTIKDWVVLTVIYNTRSRLPNKEPPVTIEKFKEILVGRRGPNVVWVEPMEPPYFRLHRAGSAHRATTKSGYSVRPPLLTPRRFPYSVNIGIHPNLTISAGVTSAANGDVGRTRQDGNGAGQRHGPATERPRTVRLWSVRWIYAGDPNYIP